MIEYKFKSTDAAEECTVFCQGTMDELVAEVGMLIGHIHYQLQEAHGPVAGAIFRELCRAATAVGAPTWDIEPAPGAISCRSAKWKEAADG